jgi:4-hydroxy-4-methyl-2-oxoglutarate aldolase
VKERGIISEELLTLGAATLGECGAAALPHRLRPLWNGARIAAPVRTIRCAPHDNLAIHAGLARLDPGEALVVDAGSIPRGYWGEVLSVGAMARRCAGLVIDGGVRDVAAIEKRRFPVFSSHIALLGTTKDKGGAIDVVLDFDKVLVRPGDWVVADEDGVVVVALEKLESVIERGKQRAAKEARMFEALAGGVTTVELLGLDTSEVEIGSTTTVRQELHQ